MSATILERARRYVVKCDRAISGQGGHNATFYVACVLIHGFALSENDALSVLREWNGSCQPPWSESDLVHKIKSVPSRQHKEPRGYLLGMKGSTPPCPALRPADRVMPPAKPRFCPMVLKRIAARVGVIGNVVDFIRLASPVRIETQDSVSVLRSLYPPGSGEKVLVFSDMRSQGQFIWDADRSQAVRDKDLPTGPDGIWFLAQPVTGEYHANPRLGGKRSRRSEEAVTSWRHAVLESDKADAEDWLRCLIQLPLRIACICESGGRSIHALVRVDAPSKMEWDALVQKIKPTLVTLGADPGALSAVRLTRLPQARRGERIQRLLFLNPTPDGTPIVRLGGTMEAKQ